MASVDVRTMVGSPERQEQKKIIHPFFGKPSKPQTRPQEPPARTPTPKIINGANTPLIVPKNHIDLTLSSPANSMAINHNAPPNLPRQETDSMEPDMNESRRKRRRKTPTGVPDAETLMRSHPSSSPGVSLDLAPINSRISSRVADEPRPTLPPPVAGAAAQPMSFFTNQKEEKLVSGKQEGNQFDDIGATSDAVVVTDESDQLGTVVTKSDPLTSTKSESAQLHDVASKSDQNFVPKSEGAPQRTLMKLDQGEHAVFAPKRNSDHVNDSTSTMASTSDKMSRHRPVKMLNLNTKSGTIGSPPPKKISKAAAKKAAKEEAGKQGTAEREAAQNEPREGISKVDDAAPRKARRSRKKAESTKKAEEVPKSLIVRLYYGKGTELKLTAKKQESPEPAKSPKTTTTTANDNAPQVKAADTKVEASDVVQISKSKLSTKPAHPFFLGKAVGKPSAQAKETAIGKPSPAMRSRQTTPSRAMPRTKATVTPRKIVRHGPQGTSVPNAINGFYAFGTAAKLQKVPGALEPAWPSKETTHVRGELDDIPILLHDDAATPFTATRMRKLKFAAPIPTAGEDILESLISRLNIEAVRQELEHVDDSQPSPPDKHMRLPSRHFESGVKLQRRISSQIKASVSERVEIDDSEDELAKQIPGMFAHPAISNLYRRVPQSLSPFDKGESDTQTWAQKYAPISAKEVLQSGPDAQILKGWLQTLTVAAVDSGTAKKESPSSNKKKDDTQPKRKRNKKLDGFVVSDDDEDNEMEEISPFDDSPPGSQGGMKTVVRRGNMANGSKEPAKLMNAVLLSGPNGCGKTAAIYAVAKELDFEVFEINSSTRRSGKDILEKVGDMTKNHLVQHKRQSGGEADDDVRRASEALDADLKSGRQGTMMSFFSKTTAPRPSKLTKPKITSKIKSQEKVVPSKPKLQQKQSLILLEEVDVLYEEDKEFWKTIIDLAASSKRPVIMTCNDESLVPKQALPLHAIIRFMPPPVEMAIDYLLLVAANEGHVLHRNAVTQLYEARLHDLRSCFTELQFWCQFGVGDHRAGFDWFIPRWPKGQDLDAHGRKLRVVSEGTYRMGMGMLGRDYLCSIRNISNAEDEMLKEAWDGWQVDAGDWHDSLKLDQWSSKAKVPTGNHSLLDALEAYEDFTDAMSTADICSHGWYGTEDDVSLDTSSPPTFSKALDDNVLGSSFIKADPVHRLTNLERDIAITMKCLAREAAHEHAAQYPNGASSSFQPITERQVDKFIITTLNGEQGGISRYDFAAALDPLASIDSFLDQSSTYLQASVIDRTTKIIALDVAPYVRGIVVYDARLAEERKKLSNLLSEGGRPGRKKMRTTRAAMSALEGGERKSTRKERWFGDKANSILVRKTGLPAWEKALEREMQLRQVQAAREREEAGVKVKKAEA